MEVINKSDDDSLKRRHFAKLHERIQNKYIEMQRRLEKSKSVDSLSTLSEDYVFVDNKYASSMDIRDSDVLINGNSQNNLRHSVIIEEVNSNDANLQYVSVRQVSVVSESETTPSERNENDNDTVTNKFFGEEFSKMSLESLNEVAKESDEYQPSPTPPPTNSIRNKIGSRISAAKDKRRQKEKERNATKDMKKESREKVEKFILSNTKQSLPKYLKRAKVATVTIALIEATGLETDVIDEKSTRLLCCRFRLGPDKYKSKVIKGNTSEVKWQELFNFNLFEDHIVEVSLWDKDFCYGRSLIDLSEMEKERTHKMRINLESEVGNSSVQIFILLTISGISLANTLMDLDDYEETQKQLATVKKKFAWYHFKDKSTNVGNLSVIVYGAKGLWSHDCCCVLELNNERLQTHTEFKTNEPNWMKIFTFDVTDVTSILDITVHDEKKSEDVGKISIPLLRIKSGEKKWYALKDANLRDRARGNNPRILVEMKLTWNLVKASTRVINPKEPKYLQTEDKVDRHIFARNLSRAKIVLAWILNAFRVLKTFLEWESTKVNFVSLIIWLLFCWFFKMWMVPLLLLIPFFWYRPPQYFLVNWKNGLLQKTQAEQEEVKKEEKNQTLRQKINSLQEMVQTVQNFIGEFANLGESIKNLFNFTVPFLSCFAIFLIAVIAFVMFMIPIKYIFMVWGIHKFTRKILRPNRIPNNEMLDLLSRVPNDVILMNCEEIPLEEVSDEDLIK
ncbi:multiple C2 and transmembrane domain-containing protein-like [Anticarsia gemmatalis]|uniref:multiple C2 and transmembrane domain-containing protein-like n=1 Tax=Anticarsia gemmatalis TaxID=129554 RepID=UPI003F7701B8